MTHGICNTCKAKGSEHNRDQVVKIQPIIAAYRQMREALAEERVEDCLNLVRKAQSEMGLSPFDLFMGVVQPLLQEIGYLWSQNRFSVINEHRFSAFAETLIANMLVSEPSSFEVHAEESIDVVLACANGNFHSIGPRALDLALRNAGLSTKLFFPGLPAADIISIVRKLRPNFLGISVSLNDQIDEVQKILAGLLTVQDIKAIKLFVGGAAVRSSPDFWKDLQSDNCIIAPSQIDQLIATMKKTA